jgi:hypothetical protein
MVPNTYSVHFVDTVAAVDPALWAATFQAPIEGLFWYRALEASELSDQFTFSYAVISRQGGAVGLAPCFLHNLPIALVAPPAVAAILMVLSKVFPRVGYQRTLFIGSPCSDEGTIGALPGEDPAAMVAALAAALETRARSHGAPMLVFKPGFPRLA